MHYDEDLEQFTDEFAFQLDPVLGSRPGSRCGGRSAYACGRPARTSKASPWRGSGAVNWNVAVADRPGASPVRLAVTNGSPAVVWPLIEASATPWGMLVNTISIAPGILTLLALVIVTESALASPGKGLAVTRTRPATSYSRASRSSN